MPIHWIIPTNQSHLPAGSRGTPSSWYYNACLPQPLAVHSVPECNFMWACIAGNVILPQAEYMWLSILPVQCQVSCVQPPLGPQDGNPSFTNRVNGRPLKYISRRPPTGNLPTTSNKANISLPSRRPKISSLENWTRKAPSRLGIPWIQRQRVDLKTEDKVQISKLNQRISSLFLFLYNSHLGT